MVQVLRENLWPELMPSGPAVLGERLSPGERQGIGSGGDDDPPGLPDDGMTKSERALGGASLPDLPARKGEHAEADLFGSPSIAPPERER